MSIVISGASGQLGRRVTQLLLDRVDPAELVVVTRTPEKLEDVARLGVPVRRGDFDDDPAVLAESFRGGERLLLISVDPIAKVRQHRTAIQAASVAGVAFVAYTSLLNPTEDNPAGIAGEHRETERMLRESGLAWAFLRHSMYAEHQLGSAEAALSSGSLFHNSGDGRVGCVSRDDCAAFAAAVVAGGDHDGRIYDVTGPEALGADELAALFGELGGRKVVPVAVDDRTLVAGMVRSGLPDDMAELVASFGVAFREGFFETVSTSVRDLTGREPRALRKVLEQHADRLAAASVGQVPA